MSSIAYDLRKIRGIAFDVDGVLSPSTIPTSAEGEPWRMVNIKDRIAIITGGHGHGTSVRYRGLGIKDVFMGVANKIEVFEEWTRTNGLEPEETAFVGDDIPDYRCMRLAGLSVAPADACHDIKEIATYISPVAGGYGVARDLLEQLLRAKGMWMSDDKAFGW